MSEDTDVQAQEEVEALVAGGWDDIEDVQEFVNPEGSFLVVAQEPKFEEGKISIRLELQECLEDEEWIAAHQEELEDWIGNVVGFQYQKKFGVQLFKRDFGDVGRELNTNGPLELLEQLEGKSFKATFYLHSYKKDGEERIQTKLDGIILA